VSLGSNTRCTCFALSFAPPALHHPKYYWVYKGGGGDHPRICGNLVRPGYVAGKGPLQLFCANEGIFNPVIERHDYRSWYFAGGLKSWGRLHGSLILTIQFYL